MFSLEGTGQRLGKPHPRFNNIRRSYDLIYSSPSGSGMGPQTCMLFRCGPLCSHQTAPASRSLTNPPCTSLRAAPGPDWRRPSSAKTPSSAFAMPRYCLSFCHLVVRTLLNPNVPQQWPSDARMPASASAMPSYCLFFCHCVARTLQEP